jgi:hypothetical protein
LRWRPSRGASLRRQLKFRGKQKSRLSVRDRNLKPNSRDLQRRPKDSDLSKRLPLSKLAWNRRPGRQNSSALLMRQRLKESNLSRKPGRLSRYALLMRQSRPAWHKRLGRKPNARD